MPTQQVDPGCDERLQDVANALLKARKVIVMTGAGISTNSGIPDFRSENGLYSLIQAQFDAAARQGQRQEEPELANESEANDSDEEQDPESRRISLRRDVDETNEKTEDAQGDIHVQADTIVVRPPMVSSQNDASDNSNDTETSAKLQDAAPNTPDTFRSNVIPVAIPTSPLSSPPADIVPPSVFRTTTRERFFDLGLPLSSSPLSSPPPNLFDPDDSTSPSDTSPSRRSSTSQSELDDTFSSSNPFSMSQASSQGQGRTSLPNMKGKDLFDASIWADPLRTSVFYTFATSLRQKIRDCEPTGSHRFISHLRDRGKLVRCYTQNIDQIEEKVGLSTSLEDGPGSRGRFSRRSTANASQLMKMVDEPPKGASEQEEPQQAGDESSQLSLAQVDGPATAKADETGGDGQQVAAKPPKLERSISSGVECVFLHGSLEHLRCFLCGRISSWDDTLASETLTGQQPECPHCIGATTARQERGKRALGVGKLRPDIVLYGEEHPNAHLISPIVTHDLSLCPDLLLILGTSLRVHGLKVLVREFAKAIHNRGGKVVFVNFTKPSESSWGDVIDYWVQWDCDDWVSDLRTRVPKLWEPPSPPRSKRKPKKSDEAADKEKRDRPPPANPAAMRDTRVAGAYWVLKILDELYRITESPALKSRAVEPKEEKKQARSKGGKSAENKKPSPASPMLQPPAPGGTGLEDAISVKSQLEVKTEVKDTDGSVDATVTVKMDKPSVAQRATKAKPRRSSKTGLGSSPGGAAKRKRPPPSTLNPHHGRSLKPQPLPPRVEDTAHGEGHLCPPSADTMTSISSILNSVKEHPRIRKRKKIDGEEIVLPRSKTRRTGSGAVPVGDSLTLAPITNTQPPTPPQLDMRPKPMEPTSPPSGPSGTVARLSAGLHQAAAYFKGAFDMQTPWLAAPGSRPISVYSPTQALPQRQGVAVSERDVAMTLSQMGATQPSLR